MGKTISGNLVAEGKRFCIIVSRFNDFVGQRLLEGAQDTLLRHGAQEKDVDTVWSPGAFEIPCLAGKIAKNKKYHAIICLGAVIRGETPHFDYIASEAAKGIASVSLSTGVPVIFGIITADSMEQAIDRAGAKAGNKGRDAARSAIEMANLVEGL